MKLRPKVLLLALPRWVCRPARPASLSQRLLVAFAWGLLVALACAFPQSELKAQTSGGILPSAVTQFVDLNGVPFANAQVFFYVPNTTTFKTTYQDQNLTVPNPNPVILNSAGRATIWGSGSYRQVLVDQFNNTIWDQITQAPVGGNPVIIGVTQCGGDTAGLEPNCTVPVLKPTSQGLASVPWFGQDTSGNPALNIPTGKALNIYTNNAGPVFSVNQDGTVNFGSIGFGNFLRGFIDGFETGAAGGTNTFTIGPGGAVDNTNHFLLAFTTSYTKNMNAWAVGSGTGCLDSGSVASSTGYFVYIIDRTDTGVADYLCSTKNNAGGNVPVLPTNYTVLRGPIAWFRTDGSSNVWQFQQRGDNFLYGTAAVSVNGAAMNTGSRVLRTLTVPNGLQVTAYMSVEITDTSGSLNEVVITSPDENDQAPGFVGLANIAVPLSSNVALVVNTRTNTAGQVADRSVGSGTISYLTRGFVYTRGRDS